VLALGTAGLLLGAALVFLLAYAFGAPLLYGGAFIPPALNTILAFTVMGLALLVVGVLFTRSKSFLDARRLLKASVVYLPLLLLLIIVDAGF